MKLNESPDRFFRISLGIMAILMLFIYGQSVTYDYTIDDSIVITENKYVQEGIKGLPGLWSYDTFHGFFKSEGKDNLVSGGRYRPWTPTLFTIERAIFGEAPWIGHLMNILTAIFTTIMLMLVIRKLLRKKIGSKGATYIASLSGIFYAVHPTHTEVIANIKGSDELWVLLASTMVLYILMKEKLNPIIKWIGIFVFSFIAMTSKENALFLLLILPLFYKWSVGIKWIELFKRTFPLFIAIGAALLLRASIVGLSTGDSSMELMNNPFLKWDGSKYIPFDPGEKIGTTLSSLLTYLRLYIFPYPLTHDYYPKQIPMVGILHWRALLSLVLYGAILAGTLLTYKKRRFVSLSLGLFLFTLLPVSNILFPIGTLASERFLFIPSLGLTLALVYGLWHLKDSLRKGLHYVFAAIIIIFVILSFNRTQAWKNNYTLFSTDVKTSSASAKINNAMAGETLKKAGEAETEEEQKRLAREAFPYADKAIEIHPLYKNAYLLRGNSFLYMQDYPNALQDFNNALALDPGFSDALNNKFLCLRIGGKYFGEVKNDLTLSETYLRQALSMRPNDYETLRLLGVNMGFQGKHREAIRHFKKALKKSSGQPPVDIIKYIGISYNEMGMPDSSQYYWRLAQQLEAQK